MAEFCRPTLDAGAHQCERTNKLGVQVALNDLRGNWRRAQAQLPAVEGLDFRRQMRARADGAGQFADRYGLASDLKAFERAAKFVIHQRQLQAESGRLGMNAMAAANHGRELIFFCLESDDLAQPLDIGEQNVRRLHHLDAKGGVNDVAASEAEMEPAAGRRANVLRDIGHEGDDVMVEGAFEFLTTLYTERRPGLHPSQVIFWHDARGAKGFAGEQFDLQPDLELALFAPDFPHGWP